MQTSCFQDIVTLQTLLASPRSTLPCDTLAKDITRIASQARNPLTFQSFATLYTNALKALDNNSLLAVCIRAYFAQPLYPRSVRVKTESRDTHSCWEGSTFPYRVYTPVEITYKWSVAAMIATFMPILEEIILVHKAAAAIDEYISGGGCETFNNGKPIFADFIVAYESRCGRPYLADMAWSPTDAADYIYRMTLTSLGSHVKRDGVTSQNLPRNRPDYTKCVRENMDWLDLVERKINCSYPMPKIRNSEIWFTREPVATAKMLATRRPTPHAPRLSDNRSHSSCPSGCETHSSSSRSLSSSSSRSSDDATSRSSDDSTSHSSDDSTSRSSSSLSTDTTRRKWSDSYASDLVSSRDSSPPRDSMHDSAFGSLSYSSGDCDDIHILISGGHVTINIFN